MNKGKIGTEDDDHLSGLMRRQLHINVTDSDTTGNVGHTNIHEDDNCGDDIPPPLTLLCDLGYGIPKEARPRKERILAISKQLVHFLSWQLRQASTTCQPAPVIVVSCPPDSPIPALLQTRMRQLWDQEQDTSTTRPPCPWPPPNFSFSPYSLEEWVARYHQGGSFAPSGTSQHRQSNPPASTQTPSRVVPTSSQATDDDGTTNHKAVVYLSPDADHALDVDRPMPPNVVVIGLLIDRHTILVNKSRDRAHQLGLATARWPLEQLVTIVDATNEPHGDDDNEDGGPRGSTVSASEPLNVDCVLEGMQAWAWPTAENGRDALVQALQHHVARHPGRPLHQNAGRTG